ncbi:MAG: trypsin-like peptidase domain-containing protein [Sedimentisphaerales bacterium]|nr:trypsin-like peptidase domain-containing protein [Sedimentisphaerales bacterium]MBN2841828.1 trypsin-like peptidase domain-containing protein [Sedimentisphaerales bacterium]
MAGGRSGCFGTTSCVREAGAGEIMQRQGEDRKLLWLAAVSVVILCLALAVLFQWQEIKSIRTEMRHLSGSNFELLSDRGTGQSRDIQFFPEQYVRPSSGLEEKSLSVCLIQGEYIFTDASGVGICWSDVKGVVAAANVTAGISSDKRRVDIQYTGSGFLVDQRGYVVTNRHIAVPWSETARDRQIIDAGFNPRVLMLRAFFPGIDRPFELELLAVAQYDDLAVLKIKNYNGSIPALDCGYDVTASVGMPVTVLGYPTGFDLITARIDSGDNALNCSSFDELGLLLAGKMLIKPMATGGICGQIVPDKIAYDAPTAIGASGSPVFNSEGKVIAVNTALLRGFTGTNFGVPVSRLKAFLSSIE